MQIFMYNMEISGHIIMIGRKHEAQILLMERIVGSNQNTDIHAIANEKAVFV